MHAHIINNLHLNIIIIIIIRRRDCIVIYATIKLVYSVNFRHWKSHSLYNDIYIQKKLFYTNIIRSAYTKNYAHVIVVVYLFYFVLSVHNIINETTNRLFSFPVWTNNTLLLLVVFNTTHLYTFFFFLNARVRCSLLELQHTTPAASNNVI